MAALTPLIGEVLGVERVPTEYRDDGRRHSARVGDAMDIEIEDQVAPRFGEDGPVMGLTGMFHPVNSTLTLARSTRARGEGRGRVRPVLGLLRRQRTLGALHVVRVTGSPATVRRGACPAAMLLAAAAAAWAWW